MYHAEAMIKYAALSVLYGHISPIATDLSIAVMKLELWENSFYKDDEELLRYIDVLRELALHRQKLNEFMTTYIKREKLLREDPDRTDFSAFKSQCDKIFQTMEIKRNYQIHLELRRVKKQPFPFVCFAVDPSKGGRVIKVLQLPGVLQLFPQAAEAVAHFWIRLVFELHLGTYPGRNGCQRVRPATITVLDGAENSIFGSHIKRILQDTFFPSGWWLRLHYGLDSAQPLFWYRWFRHPLYILGPGYLAEKLRLWWHLRFRPRVSQKKQKYTLWI